MGLAVGGYESKKNNNKVENEIKKKGSMMSTLPHGRTPQAPISNGPEHAINQAGEGRKK